MADKGSEAAALQMCSAGWGRRLAPPGPAVGAGESRALGSQVEASLCQNVMVEVLLRLQVTGHGGR